MTSLGRPGGEIEGSLTPAAARRVLREAARAIEDGKAVEPESRRYVARVLWRLALGHAAPAELLRPVVTGRPKGSGQFATIDPRRPLRLAAIVRLFELADIAKSIAIARVLDACGVTRSVLYGYVKEYAIASEDVSVVLNSATGKELDQVLALDGAESKKLATFIRTSTA